MKRILINQDDSLLADICSDLPKFQKTFIPVISSYKQLEIGDFTEDVFKSVIAGDSGAITTKYQQSLSDHLENTLVKNSVLKNFVLSGTEEIIDGFLKASKDFINTDTTPDKYGRHKDRRIFLTVSDLSFKDGELFISDDSKEQLLEKYCRLYVETEADHLVYASLLKMQSALQDFRSVMFDLGLPMEVLDMVGGRGYIVHRHIDQFFKCGVDKQVEIIPSAVKWAAKYMAEHTRMQEMYNRK